MVIDHYTSGDKEIAFPGRVTLKLLLKSIYWRSSFKASSGNKKSSLRR